MLLTLVVLCFTLSGFAALLYQTAWMRLFAIAFGTSEVSVAIVLAGYMAGLAVGAAIIALLIDRIRRPLLVYGLLEGAIAIAALMMPLLVEWTGELYALLVGNQAAPPDASGPQQALFYSIASILVLLIPTGLMGATLPLLTRYAVTSDYNLGARVSLLYSMNTAGAVLGTLVAGFLLLPAVGLRATVWSGVAVNGLVFALVVLIAREKAEGWSQTPVKESTTRQAISHQGLRFVLPLIALSGVLSFIYEVLWTRMLSHVLGSSIYAFSTMLAAFLTGITLGAAGAGLVSKNSRQSAIFFALCQFGVALSSALVYWRLEHWQPSGTGLAALAFAVILPSSVFIGATYPLAVRAVAANERVVGRVSAVVYSWNTVGAIVGALAGGFFIIPQLGFAGTARFAVVSNMLIGILVLMLLLWQDRRQPGVLPGFGTALVLLLATLFVFQPQRPDALVTETIFGGSGENAASEVYYSVGRSSTVYLAENAYRFDLSTNGLPEAQIEFDGTPPLLLSQRWLGLWPSLARPDTDSMLVVGLGGGVVLEGIPDQVSDIDVVELEPEVVRANAAVGSRRSRDPLSDERFRIVNNDARNALRLTSKRYDAIVSQPSHPWTAGASHLFTREFFTLVKSRLAEGGVFVQWMNAEFLDEPLLRGLAATLRSEFKYVRIYQPASLALHFIAADSPLSIERQLAASGRPILDAPHHFSRNGINGPADIIATLLLDEAGVNALVKGGQLITDNDNRMAVDSNVDATGLAEGSLTRITGNIDPLLNSDSWLRRQLSDVDLAYIGWRLLDDGQTSRLGLLAASLDDPASQNILQAMLLRYRGRYGEASRLLETILPGDQVYEQAVFLRLIDQLPWIRNGTLALKDLPELDWENSRLGTVIQGWRMLGLRDWQGIYALDKQLFATGTSDLWAPYAAQLQAEWRFRARDKTGRLKAKALEFLDRSLATNATLDAYALRARIGLALDNRPVFVESTAFVVRTIQLRVEQFESNGMALTDVERSIFQAQLEWMARDLRAFLAADSTGRTTRVLSELSELENYLSEG